MTFDYRDTDGHLETAITLEAAQELLARFRSRHAGAEWDDDAQRVSTGTMRHLKIDRDDYMVYSSLWNYAWSGDPETNRDAAAILIPLDQLRPQVQTLPKLDMLS